MTYLSGKANKRKKNTRYLIYISIIVLLVIFWSAFKNIFYPILEPLVMRYAVTKTIFKDVPEFFHTYTSSVKDLTQRNKNLEVDIEYLENKIAEKDAKLKELNFVKNEIGMMPTESTIVMYPLMQDITKIYSTIILSKGFKEGIEKDMYVYVRGLQPVCIIKEVYTSTSLCELISKSGVTTEVVVKGKASSTISFTLTGRGGGTFLGDVARDTLIDIGDEVYLKSDPSMKLGNVVNVMNNNQDTSWRVFVSGEYNPVTSSIFYTHKK
jgi:cell shape-determining protein MreC